MPLLARHLSPSLWLMYYIQKNTEAPDGSLKYFDAVLNSHKSNNMNSFKYIQYFVSLLESVASSSTTYTNDWISRPQSTPKCEQQPKETRPIQTKPPKLSLEWIEWVQKFEFKQPSLLENRNILFILSDPNVCMAITNQRSMENAFQMA